MDQASTILVVDDEEGTRALLEGMLSEDYAVICASGGQEALDMLTSGAAEISLVLLDLMMAEVDGLRVLERLRGDKVLSQIPVIVVTASEDEGLCERALSLGAQDLLNKPLQRAVVLLRVSRALRLRNLDALAAEHGEVRQIKRYVDELERTLSDTPCGVCQLICGGGADVAYANAEFFRLRGREAHRRLTDARTLLLRTIHPDDFAAVRKAVQGMLGDSAAEQALQYRILRDDGSIRLVQGRVRVQPMDGGWTVRLAEIDVTGQQKRTRNERRLLEHLPGGMAIVRLDPMLTVVSHNPGLAALLGLAEEERAAVPLAAYLQDQASAVRGELMAQDSLPQSVETVIHRPDGTPVPVIISGVSDLGALPVPVAYCQFMDVTVQAKYRDALEQALRGQSELTGELNAFLCQVLPKTSMTAWRLDLKHRTITCYGALPDPRWTEALHHPPESLMASDMLLPEAKAVVRRALTQLEQGVGSLELMLHVRRGEGTRYVRMTISRVPGAPLCIGLSEDLTDQVRIEQHLQRERQYREAMGLDALCSFEADLTADALLQPDAALTKRLTLPADAGYLTTVRVMAQQLVSECSRMEFLDRLNTGTLMHGFAQGVHRVQFDACLTPDTAEHPLWTNVSCHLIRAETDGHITMTCRIVDVDAVKRGQLALQERAQRDALTGLYNRAAFENIVRERIDVCCACGCGALLMLDVDDFKHINDAYGHQVGDRVLTGVAQHVSTVFRAGDVIGRMGGDELSVFVPDCGNRDIILSRARQIIHNVCEDATLPGVTLSVGLAYLPEAGRSFRDLYLHADNALYAAKRRGKHDVCVWVEEDEG